MNKKTIDPKDEFLEVSVPYEKVGLCFSNVSIELVSSKHDVEDLGNIALSLYELIKELDK